MKTTNTTEHWHALLNENRVQNGPVLTYREFAKHEQPEAVGLLSWLVQSGSDEPWPVPNIPGMPKYVQDDPYAVSPALGQHTREVMDDLGYSETEIEKLVADGVIT